MQKEVCKPQTFNLFDAVSTLQWPSTSPWNPAMSGDNKLPVRNKSQDQAQEGMGRILLGDKFEYQVYTLNLSAIMDLEYCNHKWFTDCDVELLYKKQILKTYQVWRVDKSPETNWPKHESWQIETMLIAADMNWRICWVHHINNAGTCLLLPECCSSGVPINWLMKFVALPYWWTYYASSFPNHHQKIEVLWISCTLGRQKSEE